MGRNLVAGERLTSLGTALALGMMQCTSIGTGVGPLLPTWVLRNPFAGVIDVRWYWYFYCFEPV